MGLASRAATMGGLLAVLGACVRFEAYSVLYLAFSMPGIAEFVTMSQHDGDGGGEGGNKDGYKICSPRNMQSTATFANLTKVRFVTICFCFQFNSFFNNFFCTQLFS